MIFVTLGTQKFQFNRLLRMMDDLIENKKSMKEYLHRLVIRIIYPNIMSIVTF